MNKSTLLPILAIIVGASVLAAQSADEKPHWHADWATAQRIAAKANKPVFAILVCKH